MHTTCSLLSVLILCASQSTFIIEGEGLNPIFGVAAQFGARLPTNRNKPLSGLVVPGGAQNGCVNDYPPTTRENIAMVTRGNCTFNVKAENAQAAGAVMLLVVQDSDNRPFTMASDDENVKIPCGMLYKDDGIFLASHPPVYVGVWLHWIMFDWSSIVLWVGAVILVGAAAWWSAAPERSQAKGGGGGGEADHDAQYMTTGAASCFMVFASISLLLLFFFIKQLVWVLLLFFAIGSINTLSLCLSPIFKHFFKHTWLHDHAIILPYVYVRLTLLDAFVLVLSTIIPTIWFFHRRAAWSWIPQDIMCVSLCMVIQQQLRLPNIKVSTVLLVTAFAYDIFWVFLSPLFFTSSVMVTVATGGDSGEQMPMLFRIPHFDEFLGGDGMIGLGDIALPGLLVSFFLRFDYHNLEKTNLRRGYFVFSLLMYALGLGLCNIALSLTRHGQPALLYLVPTCLGGTCALAYTRGELKMLWTGDTMEQYNDDDYSDDDEETSGLMQGNKRSDSFQTDRGF